MLVKPDVGEAPCKNCFTCETKVDKTWTKEMVEADRASRCKNCFSCQQNVSKKPEGGSQDEFDARCQNCYRCETDVSKDIKADLSKPQGAGPPTFTWYLFPTNGCNIACSYCYAHNKPGKMTRETMHEMLNFLFIRQPHKNINCHFFGGEPTVMWEMLVDIVQMGNEMAANSGVTVTWSMTTNGTLLTEEKLQWIKANFRGFLLSLDGRPETHDKYRVTAKGDGTHELIPVDRILEMFPNCEVRPTINPDTAADWFEDYKWLRNKGFKSIAIEPNYEVEWSLEQIQAYENTLRQLGKYWLYARMSGKPIRMKFVDETVTGLKQRQPPDGRMCGVGFNCSAIDHRGMLYACQRYASYNNPEKFAIGDIQSGFDEFKLLETQALFRSQVTGDVSKGFNCATCSVRMFCHKGCNAANIKFMDDRRVSLPMYCILQKSSVKIGLETLNEAGLLGIGQSDGQQKCKC